MLLGVILGSRESEEKGERRSYLDLVKVDPFYTRLKPPLAQGMPPSRLEQDKSRRLYSSRTSLTPLEAREREYAMRVMVTTRVGLHRDTPHGRPPSTGASQPETAWYGRWGDP